MGVKVSVLVPLLFPALLILLSISEGKRRTPKECIIFPTHYSDVLRTEQGCYIELGEMTVDDTFEIELQVLPSAFDHDGNLFAIGSKREFPYYEWRTKANGTQYLVVEIVYSSVLLTLKALGTYNLHSLEIYRTFPEPYDIGDGRWHSIRAWRSPGQWNLRLDDIEVSEPIRMGPDNSNDGPSDSTNVQLENMPAFLGGRPGYIDLQFRGIMKNVKVNGKRLSVGEMSGMGNFEVVRCQHKAVRNFTDIMDAERHQDPRLFFEEEEESSFYDHYRTDTGSETSFFDHEDVDDNQQPGSIGGVY